MKGVAAGAVPFTSQRQCSRFMVAENQQLVGRPAFDALVRVEKLNRREMNGQKRINLGDLSEHEDGQV
jgi:hypothetical protein